MAEEYWMNPSRSAVIYDRRNNRTIQPGEKVYTAPDPGLVAAHKLLHVADGQPSRIITGGAHGEAIKVRLASVVQLEEKPAVPPQSEAVEETEEEELELAGDTAPKTTVKSRRKK